MTNLEKLRTATPEQIKDLFCNKYGDCLDVCPSFVFERCKEGKNGILEWLNEEAIAPKNAPEKEWMKLKEELCSEIGSCDKCPPTIARRCNEAFKAMEDWKKPQEPKDAPRGWIKLKAIVNADDDTLYIKVSTIVSVGHSIDVNTIDGKRVTAVSTLYAEDDPWLVYDSIDEVMEKIGKA